MNRLMQLTLLLGAFLAASMTMLPGVALAHEDPTMQHPHNAYGGHLAAGAEVPDNVTIVQSAPSRGYVITHRDYMVADSGQWREDAHVSSNYRSYLQGRNPRRWASAGRDDYGVSERPRRQGRWNALGRAAFMTGGAYLGNEIHGKGVAGEIFGAMLGQGLHSGLFGR